MKLLAWDTSSKTGVIVAMTLAGKDEAAGPPHLVAEWTLDVGLAHSERLLWAIDQTLASARWQLEDVDVFGVGVGPGSFTGLRIGITTARTLANTLKKPLVGISSLAALVRPVAMECARHYPKKSVVVVASTDACKGELFAIYGDTHLVALCTSYSQDGPPGLWKAKVEERVLTPENLIQDLKKTLTSYGKTSHWIAIGEGSLRYPDVWKKLPKSKQLTDSILFPNQIQGRFIGLLACEAYVAGLAQEPLKIHPRYLRASDAELKLRSRVNNQCALPYVLQRVF